MTVPLLSSLFACSLIFYNCLGACLSHPLACLSFPTCHLLLAPLGLLASLYILVLLVVLPPLFFLTVLLILISLPANYPCPSGPSLMATFSLDNLPLQRTILQEMGSSTRRLALSVICPFSMQFPQPLTAPTFFFSSDTWPLIRQLICLRF